MILCVSQVSWTDPTVNEDGTSSEREAILELTDGWYKIQARVDEPLTRAIRRSTIRMGTKLAMSGIQVIHPLWFAGL